ncbi:MULTISPECIES: L-seryl-tRNA(Sec) selenium transferase [Rhodomicrobium]|uniref:L-seryl-tRNA(Sec) selenium transferase n=1 Tax=Rhodomicrobium TaxID=1068 RepID=UPI0024780984|nr:MULTISPECIES: L-seryl-tRNA(Sec) selenium transferase [Rhodomicrobium]
MPDGRAKRPVPPSVDAMLKWASVAALEAEYGRVPVVEALRGIAGAIREGRVGADEASVAAAARTDLARRFAQSQRRVFNLTGTVLHTNLGRALIAEDAIAAAVEAMRAATTLEYELEAGQRGERDRHIEAWLTELTGAAAASAVNNNAAAVLLVLAALARGKDVIVSRGELVEIGGSFRIPDIMRDAGCRLVEVGTTNRTHLADYERAIGPETGLIMKVHCSNYAIKGFTKSIAISELAALGRERGIPVIEDLGSGTLTDLRRYGLPYEPTAAASIKAGADIVTFSGDKLLGGPQAGFIAGRKDLVRQIAKHPMKRALRLDKIRLAAIEATLKLYADPERLRAQLPTIRLLARPAQDIRAAAERLLPALSARLPGGLTAEIAPCHSQIGSGALPLDLMPSFAITFAAKQARGSGTRLEALAAKLRALPVPVIGRIADGRLWLDLRCLEAHDEPALAAQFADLAV